VPPQRCCAEVQASGEDSSSPEKEVFFEAVSVISSIPAISAWRKPSTSYNRKNIALMLRELGERALPAPGEEQDALQARGVHGAALPRNRSFATSFLRSRLRRAS